MIEGDVLVLGIENKDTLHPCDAECDSGAVFVYRRLGGTWLEEARLVAPDAACGERFGRTVAIDADRILVGAQGGFQVAGGGGSPTDTIGSGYVFRRTGTAWQFEQKLTAPNGQVGDLFGNGVDIQDDYAVITAPGENGNQGAAYVFHFDGSLWSLQARIAPPDPWDDQWFGFYQSVSLDGERIAVGAPRYDNTGLGFWAGAAYVFRRTDTIWDLEGDRLLSNSTNWQQGNIYFGNSVSISGNLLSVGAPFYGSPSQRIGEVYMFVPDSTDPTAVSWVHDVRIDPDPPIPWDEFGSTVLLSGTRLVLCMPRHDAGGGPPDESGAVFVYDRDANGAWNRTFVLADQTPMPGDQFGTHIALSGERLAATNANSTVDPACFVFDLSGAACANDSVVECPTGTPYCLGDGNSLPSCACGNASHPELEAGCANSTGVGAPLAGIAGSPSVHADDLVLSTICLPPVMSGFFFHGPMTAQTPFGAGLMCVAAPIFRHPLQNSGLLGQLTLGPGIVYASNGQIQAGETRYFQVWYRDPNGPCATFNLSNGLELAFEP